MVDIHDRDHRQEGLMKLLFTILSDLGYPVSDNIQQYYTDIHLWEDWWRGYVPDFHNYWIRDVQDNGAQVKRKQMRMAKKLCEDWANLLLNDKTRILIECGEHDTNRTQKWLTGDTDEQNGGILGKTGFWVKGNKAVEREFAQGTVCFYWQLTGATEQGGELAGEGLELKVIKDAQMIVPLTYDDEDITDVALASNYTQDGQEHLYVQIFKKLNDDGEYLITNHFYRVNRGGGYEEVPGPHGEVESYVLPCKPFVIMKPNIENNIADVPLGASIYANAIDNLQLCDLSYDNMFMDTLLGKKRVFMDQAAVQLKPKTYAKDENGQDRVVQQEPDIGATLEKSLYVTTGEALPGDPKFFNEYNPSLRVDENKENVQFNLNLLSAKVGLGQNRYQFNQANMTTATQVKASNKDLTESVWKQRIAIQEALKDLTRSALILGREKLHQPLDVDARITIQFDDTMFADEEAERMRFMQEIAAGIRQKWEYRVKYDGEDEETARKMTGETAAAQQQTLAGQFNPGDQTGANSGPNGANSGGADD